MYFIQIRATKKHFGPVNGYFEKDKMGKNVFVTDEGRIYQMNKYIILDKTLHIINPVTHQTID